MVGVALEGGGARGSYHIGALKALRKCGIYPDGFVGTSIGSVNAALAAIGDIKRLENVWKSLTCEEIFNIDNSIVNALQNKNINRKTIIKSAKTIKEIITNSGIDTKYLKKIYKDNIDEEVLRKSGKDFGLVTYGFTDKKPIEIFKEDIPKGKLHDYLIASCYLPIFKMEKIIDDKYYLDGGFHDNCPINMLLRKGYDEIYAIRTYGPGLSQKLIENDANIVYIAPKENLGSIILFDEESTRRNIELGFYDALKAIKHLDGNKYYFRNKDVLYYNKITEDVTEEDLIYANVRIIDRKKITLRIFEKLMDEFEIEKFKVWNIALLVIKLKSVLKYNTDHKYYNFIKKLKIVF